MCKVAGGCTEGVWCLEVVPKAVEVMVEVVKGRAEHA